MNPYSRFLNLEMASWKVKLPLKILLPILLLSAFTLGAVATNVVISQQTLQSQSGILYNVTGGFSATGNGFYVVQSAGTASTLPCTWTSGGTCQTALTSGDWEYSITVTINSNAAASTTYTVNVNWNTGSGNTAMGSLTLKTPSTITAGQTMTFLFDTTVTSFNAPTTIQITIQ